LKKAQLKEGQVKLSDQERLNNLTDELNTLRHKQMQLYADLQLINTEIMKTASTQRKIESEIAYLRFMGDGNSGSN